MHALFYLKLCLHVCEYNSVRIYCAFFLSVCMVLWVSCRFCVCMQWLRRPEEHIRSLGTGVTGCFKPPEVDAGNRTWVLLQEQYVLLTIYLASKSFSVLPACLCILCMQYLRRPEEGVRSTGTGIAGSFMRHHIGAGN